MVHLNKVERAVISLINQAKAHQAAQHGCEVEDMDGEGIVGLCWLEFVIKQGGLRAEKKETP